MRMAKSISRNSSVSQRSVNNKDRRLSLSRLGGYAITSLGTMRQKLEYVFAVYDKDKNNSIDRKEMIHVISAMYDLLGKSREQYSPERCVEDIFSVIDVNHDRALNKDEFIDGVMKNPYLSDLVSPFNE